MKDKILDISTIIEKYDIPVFERTLSMYKEIDHNPSMSVVLTSDDSGSISYMKGIRRFCRDLGITFQNINVSSGKELEETIEELNHSDTDGIMVMFPTPFDHRDSYYMNKIAIEKDVEGLHYSHLGYLVQFEKFRDTKKLRKLVIPPTPKGILYIFKKHFEYFEEMKEDKGIYPGHIDKNPFLLEGKRITVINDSLSVGRSLALMMLNENASVQICHKYTPYDSLLNFVKTSDIIVSAVPSSSFRIPTESVPSQSIVIDISFEGNFEYPSIFDKVYKIAPKWNLVEKGNRINDMTLYRLISNLFYLINARLPDKILIDM